MSTHGKLIVCLSDFGLQGHYVGAMRGVLASLAPQARILDITHCVPQFDVAEGAETLLQGSREFPAGTIFLAVVDPGVGTDRRALAARTMDGSFWVGPDNGLFWPVFAERGLSSAHSLENQELRHQSSTSSTFHGRDLFAPAAAHLATGVALERFGPRIEDPVTLELPAGRAEGNCVRGTICRVDEFGNLITSIASELLAEIGARPGGGQLKISVGTSPALLVPFESTYADAGACGAALALMSSSGALEVALNQASFAAAHGAKTGDTILAEWCPT